MIKKKKKFVWHKKKAKFIPSTAEKTHSMKIPKKDESQTKETDKEKRLKIFSKNLSDQIKKAVRKKPD